MITKTIHLDAWNPAEIRLTILQGEVGARSLQVYVMSNGAPINLSGCKAEVYFTMPDNATLTHQCSITDPTRGEMIVPLTLEMSAVAGILRDVELQITGITSGSVLKIRGLTVEVQPTVDYGAMPTANGQ